MQSRRDFLEFLGRSSAVLAWSGSALAQGAKGKLPFTPLVPTASDTLVFADGFKAEIIIREGDPLTATGGLFGTFNDYLAYFPLNKAGDDGILWVNHEDLTPPLVSGHQYKGPKSKEQVDKERLVVGGSLVRVQRGKDGRWSYKQGDAYCRRFDGLTPIPFAGGVEVAGARVALGTFGNCAGGVTPWGTVLTCEENYQNFYGELDYEGKDSKKRLYGKTNHMWDTVYPEPSPEHYGWVVEIEPKTGVAKKHTALGRFAHEGATVVLAKDGRAVVYMGDDAEGQFVYKFIAAKKGSLEKGELFVADTEKGEWKSLDLAKSKVLQQTFKTQLDVLIRTRHAAKLVGGTPLDRPEDIEQDPLTKAMIVALTNNKTAGRPHGSLLRIDEEGRNPLSLRFKATTFLAGGPETGFSSPDNLAFDRHGNLWMTSDISTSSLGKGDYAPFGNNSLFFIPMTGSEAGKVHRVASAPTEAEFTGPCFIDGGKTLLLSVQHPGEETLDPAKPTSTWPGGPGTLPRSAVIAVTGPALT